jgi:hypothetical protein
VTVNIRLGRNLSGHSLFGEWQCLYAKLPRNRSLRDSTNDVEAAAPGLAICKRRTGYCRSLAATTQCDCLSGNSFSVLLGPKFRSSTGPRGAR